MSAPRLGDVDRLVRRRLDVELRAQRHDVLDDRKFLVLVLGHEFEDGIDLGDDGQRQQFLGEIARIVEIVRHDRGIDRGDLGALVVLRVVHHLVERLDRRRVLVVEMEQVIVEPQLAAG